MQRGVFLVPVLFSGTNAMAAPLPLMEQSTIGSTFHSSDYSG